MTNNTTLIGCLSSKECVDVMSQEGTSPLMESIVHSKYNIVKILLELGADPLVKNNFGINSYVFAYWIGNQRIKRLLPETDYDVKIHIDKLKEMSSKNSDNATILFLGNKRKNIVPESRSTLGSRMDKYINLSQR